MYLISSLHQKQSKGQMLINEATLAQRTLHCDAMQSQSGAEEKERRRQCMLTLSSLRRNLNTKWTSLKL